MLLPVDTWCHWQLRPLRVIFSRAAVQSRTGNVTPLPDTAEDVQPRSKGANFRPEHLQHRCTNEHGNHAILVG